VLIFVFRTMPIRTLYLTGALMLACLISSAQEVWTIGPMLHYNFGGGKKTTSFAIEAAYWNIYKFPYGLDFGIEFDKQKVRLYSEVQTGIGITGVALGPVVEFNSAEHHTRLGVQGSVWANYFLGFDYRFRTIDNQTFHAPGIYGKLPVAQSGFEESSSNSSWGDFDDWD
jgi:hypothetical protein